MVTNFMIRYDQIKSPFHIIILVQVI